MADQQQPKQINFTIVPDDSPTVPRTYSNFCSIAHTPFDFTLTFCEVQPLSEKEIREAEAEHVVRAPVRARIVLPVQFIPTLIAALQENMRIYSESHSPAAGQPHHAANLRGARRRTDSGRGGRRDAKILARRGHDSCRGHAFDGGRLLDGAEVAR